jgi:N-acetylmuramoyl-L-alanine amidase
VKRRAVFAPLLVLCLILPVLLAAQGEREARPAGRRSAVVLDGRELPVPVTIVPSGPLFGLLPIANALGAKLTSDPTGESLDLEVGGKTAVLAPGNSIVTVGEEIITLTQPPAEGDGGIQVPLDFLRKTFGDVLGYAFEWQPETSHLAISRRAERQLNVAVDLVHTQGMTTVVLQFPEAPRYHINKVATGVEVQMLADRIGSSNVKPVQDPLVRAVTVEPDKIAIQLAAGAEAESYVLENPFRLVFDVHPTAAVAGPASPNEPSERHTGIRTIVVDPGHGGSESGAVGPSGVLEKALTLLLARELAAKLEAELPVKVLLTRTDDTNLSLDNRSAIANQNKADLFISIHLNSSLGNGATGAETYFLSSQASDRRAELAAQSENVQEATSAGDDATAQQDLQLILWDLAQSRHMAESQRFANLVQAELNETLQLKDRGVKQAPFRVLVGAAMPAVLVELGFINNADEEKKLQEPAYRAQLADSLTKAVTRYKAAIEGTSAPAAGPAAAPVPGVAPGTQPPAPPAAAPSPHTPKTSQPSKASG